MLKKRLLCVMVFAQMAYAEPVVELAPTVVKLQRATIDGLGFDQSKKASDAVVERETLKHRSSTLGNALSSELGVHANPFGGGSSAPVVRGQEGVRIKVLHNNLGVADMSNISPDHAIAVDTLLANRVEIVRGASTLMHSASSPAGVINVVDGRIPKSMPSGVEGETLLRFNTGSDEKLATASVAFGLGEHVAVRAEGMSRKSNPYNVPAINFGEILDYLPDSQNKTQVGTFGVSYIGDRGFVGLSHSHRREDYGLVGHNHKYDNCSAHILDTSMGSKGRAYLLSYPHLMADEDMIDGLHFHCGSDHDLDKSHSHDNVYGHKHDHTQHAPWLEMKSVSTAMQGEWYRPLSWIDKIRLQANISNYKHTELDEGKTLIMAGRPEFIKGNPVYYGNDAKLAKLSFHHTPKDNMGVVWGLDYQNNRTHASIPSVSEKQGNRRPLVENKQNTMGLFALSSYQKGDWTWEAGYRFENSKIPVDYDLSELDGVISHYANLQAQDLPDLTTYKNHANSYALSTLWQASDKLKFDATYSHNERIPTPMELYYHGKHLATNSFLFGNKALNKEKSDNLEFGVKFQGDLWDFKGSIYGNKFDNYIHPENLYKVGNLTMRRFTQSKAKIHGMEFAVGYQFHPDYKLSFFGDKVRGKLYGFSPIFVGNIYGDPVVVGYDDPSECGYSRSHPDYEEECAITEYPIIGQETITRPDRHAPRMSPDRLGFRLNGEHGEHWSSSLEYSRVFAQNRVSNSVASKYDSECPYHEFGRDKLCPIYISEDKTGGYHLLNAGLDYHNHWGRADYTLSLRANNLLNEKVYVHNSFLPFVPQQGRNVSVSLNVKF